MVLGYDPISAELVRLVWHYVFNTV